MSYSDRVCRAFEEILPCIDTGEDLVIVAHGGTQMALLERYGFPEREYYRWQRPCGCGWQLKNSAEEKKLVVQREIAFLR